METVVRNVRDLRADDRSAAEQLVGQAIRENQKLVIQAVNVDLAAEHLTTGTGEGRLPEWCNVYAGLSDEEIEKLEQAILRRRDESRRLNEEWEAVDRGRSVSSSKAQVRQDFTFA